MDDVIAFSNILMAIVIIIIWLTVVVMFVIGVILGKIYEKRFFLVVKENLVVKNFELNKCAESIRNAYEVYRRHRFGFSNKKIVSICQEFASNLRIGKGLDSIDNKHKDEWADRLDEVIKRLQYEEHFDDEKANEIIIELDEKISNDSISRIKQKLTFLEAYHKGIISVKNAEIQELKEKIQRKQWITWVSAIIGIVGSLASIFSIFK